LGTVVVVVVGADYEVGEAVPVQITCGANAIDIVIGL